MPEMKTTLFGNLEVIVELDREGNVDGYATLDGVELELHDVRIQHPEPTDGKRNPFNPYPYPMTVEDYLQPQIQDYMENFFRDEKEYHAELRKDQKSGR